MPSLIPVELFDLQDYLLSITVCRNLRHVSIPIKAKRTEAGWLACLPANRVFSLNTTSDFDEFVTCLVALFCVCKSEIYQDKFVSWVVALV